MVRHRNPTFLINLLKQQGLYDFKLTEQSQIEFDSFDLEDLRPYGLLYQTAPDPSWARRVRHLPTRLPQLRGGKLHARLPARSLRRRAQRLRFSSRPAPRGKAFENDDLEQVMKILKGMFSSIPFQLYEKTPERFFHAAIHLLFSYMGLRIRSEPCTAEGRADAAVETTQRVYILEFKG
ncbi:MAG: PD-(D/E)XK nuclease domain-containing protein [Saprospirales bacterium]|nr:PD-(D/E)XK nuclease domain-containing protein [Saprospirales bacterium]